MDSGGKQSYIGEGELAIGDSPICKVNYLLAGTDARPEDVTRKQHLHFIGALLLLAENGEGERVLEASERRQEFILKLENNQEMMVFLSPESPGVGLYEIMTRSG